MIVLITVDLTPDRDSLPVFQAREVVAVASLPGARAETLTLETDPARVLRHLGVHDYGGMATPGFSGLPSRHTHVLLQGIPVNSPATGSVDLSLLPMSLFTRGLATVSGRPGLALWLPVGPEAHLTTGSFGLASAAGFARTGPLLLGLSFRRADNCFPYLDEFGRPFKRENADETQIGFAGLFGRGDVSAFLMASVTERGVPGPLGFPTPFARLSDTLLIASLSWRGTTLFAARDAVIYSDEEMFSPTVATNVGLSCSGSHLGFEVSRASALHAEVFQARGQTSLVREKWFCRAGALAWKGPVSSLALPAAEVGLSASWFRAEVFLDAVPPAINDLDWPYDGFAAGNPTLRPERMWGGELGYDTDIARAWVSLKIVEDYIAWVPGEKWMPVNLDRVMSPELGASLKVAFLEAGLAWNPVRWRGKRLAYAPDWRGFARITAGPVWFSLNHTGERATTPGGVRELPCFALFDAGITIKKGRLTTDVSFLNLLGKTPQQIAGYPLPGRRFVLEITWRLR